MMAKKTSAVKLQSGVAEKGYSIPPLWRAANLKFTLGENVLCNQVAEGIL